MNIFGRTKAEIDISALIHNFNKIKELSEDCEIIAVVKANAYGHGVHIVAPVLDKAGANRFAVATLSEALQLREMGIKKPILILGYTSPDAAEILAKNNISQCVYDFSFAKMLSQSASAFGVTVKIHLKLDTGMSRLGFDCRDESLQGIGDAVLAAKLENLENEGVFTHFSVSDRNQSNEDGFTSEQYQRFKMGVDALEKAGVNTGVCHCCNSGGILNDPDKRFSAVRPGIILYGLNPDSSEPLEGFLPVMTFKTTVSMVKEVKAGDTVSYGRTFKADKIRRLATLTAGYADGYPRLLSNRGCVVINGQKAPVVGRVCMDQTVVDITDLENVKIGDEAVLFGVSPSAEEVAALCGTINYELVCGITDRVKRIGVNEL